MPIEFISAICEGKKIYGILHLPRIPRPPCVICSHGLFSSKESEKFIAIGEHFSANGIAVIRYDHLGCGESEGDLRDTTTTSRIAQLGAMIELAVRHPLLGDRIGLLGSSMGGFISIFKGKEDRRVRALVLWATPAHLRGGREEIEQQEGTQLGDPFYEDVKKYDAATAIRGLRNCLILHGEKDELVPPQHAELLYSSASPPKHLEIFPAGDHRFRDPSCRQKAIEMSLAWFKRYL